MNFAVVRHEAYSNFTLKNNHKITKYLMFRLILQHFKNHPKIDIDWIPDHNWNLAEDFLSRSASYWHRSVVLLLLLPWDMKHQLQILFQVVEALWNPCNTPLLLSIRMFLSIALDVGIYLVVGPI